MKSSRTLLFSLFISVAFMLPSCWGWAATFTQYPLVSSSAAGNVCAGPDGNVWFMLRGIISIGSITPAGRVTAFVLPWTDLPLEPSLVGCAFGPDGRLYFADQNNKKVMTFDPALKQFTRISMPAPNTGIAGLAFGADGNAWIMVPGNNAIRRMTQGGIFLPVIQLAAGRYPHGPSSCPDGNVWFAEFNANRVARANMLGQVTEVLLPNPASKPFSTACGPDGVYFTEQAGRLGRVAYTSLAITEWILPTSKGEPAGIAVSPKGNVYFAESSVGRIGMMPVGGGMISEYVISASGFSPDKLTLGSDGRVWFSLQQLGKIVAVQ
jgi:virginiamycin B lyase